MSAPRYDAIVIGAGANGLVAAQYLARAGKRVLVVEQHETPDPSLDIGWVAPQIIKDLRLESFGLRVDQPDPWVSAPVDDRETLELSRDLRRSVDAIRRLSPRDAEKWPEFCTRMRALATVLERLYLVPPPDVETRDPRELARIGGLGLYVRRLGRQTVIDLARVLPMSIAELLDDWFENDVLKGLLGALGVWHLKQGPRSGGTAFNFLHHHAGSPLGVFRPPTSNLTATLLTMPGVDIRRGQEGLPLTNPKTAVLLGPSGDTIDVPLILSSADPRSTFQYMQYELDPEYVHAISKIKCRGVAARGTLARSNSPAANWCIAPSLVYLERAYDDAKYGRASANPYVEVQQALGRIEVHAQYAPYTGTMDAHRGFKEQVARLLGIQADELALRTPDVLDFNRTEGNLYHGELTLDQILFMRPVPGWSRYRTPIEGLYLCGAGTHPGGGIPGAAGRNAAREIV